MKKFAKLSSVASSFLLLTVVGIVVFCIGLRLYALTSSPSGFFVDESSIGYNAWTILQSGKDEHGILFPLYFKAFGDYKNPIFVYSVSLVFWLLGPSLATVRLTAALWGIGALAVFLWLLYSAKLSRWMIVLTSLLVVTNPWFFQLSRVAFEVAALPFFLFFAALAFYKLTEKVSKSQKYWIAWLSTYAVSLGLFFYSYTSARILAPGLCIIGVGLLYKKIHWKYLAASCVLFGICVLPAVISQLSNPDALLARYQVVGLSNYTHSPQEFVQKATINYIAHFSPLFLLEGGDGNLRHVPDPFGVLLIASLPFVLAGLVSAFTKRAGRFSWWVLAGIVLSPIPSALTIQSPHALRSIGLLVFFCILFWYGVEYMLTRTRFLALCIVCSVLLCIESVFFFSFYFHSYTERAEIWFDTSTVKLIESGVTFPGPYFLSSKLYPGTYTTVDFLRIVHDPTVKIPLEETTIFDPEEELPKSSGVFFFDSDTCAKLPQDFLDAAQKQSERGGNCVYTK